MDDRGARLLPRLFARLDTVESEGEIASTVLCIRAMAGPAAFSGALIGANEDTVPLTHPDRRVVARLRSLSTMLRYAGPADDEGEALLQRVARALWDGTPVERADLLVVLAYLPDLLRARAPAEAELHTPPLPSVADEVRGTMNELWQLLRKL
jgi:hypothetical protein